MTPGTPVILIRSVGSRLAGTEAVIEESTESSRNGFDVVVVFEDGRQLCVKWDEIRSRDESPLLGFGRAAGVKLCQLPDCGCDGLEHP